MSEWIEKMRAEKELRARRDTDAAQEEMRRHTLVRLKAPILWNELVSFISSDIEKVRDAFPSERSMHLRIEHRPGDGLTISNVELGKSLMIQFDRVEPSIKALFS